MIHVCYGTQAELIKLAPVLVELARRGVAHRIVETGQHGSAVNRLRETFGIAGPDAVLWDQGGVYSNVRAGLWMASILSRLAHGRRRLRREVFPGGGVMLIHGDTFSTLVATILAKGLGMKLAHVESGLRSFNYLNPFPEELVRVFATSRADVLFPPGSWAAENLRKANVRGTIVELPMNTGAEALSIVLSGGQEFQPRRQPYAVASIHRFETVSRPGRLRQATEVVRRASKLCPVVWPMHEVTRRALAKARLLDELTSSGVELTDVLGYRDFAHLVKGARFVLADGGTIQEESYYLDKPCLLLRQATERREGLGENVVVSRWRPSAIDAFLADPGRYRRLTPLPQASAGACVVDALEML